MKLFLSSTARIVVLGLLLVGVTSVQVSADGDETLGVPVGVTIASGTGIVAAGTGLFTQPGTINVDVPLGATVQQVLLYWYGRGSGDGVNGDDDVYVNGNLVAGTLIGESLGLPFPPSQVYRADITRLQLVAAGSNVLSVTGMNYTFNNDGAGVFVIFDDGSGYSDIQIRDGHDFAAWNQGFSDPLDRTVPQAFNFAPAACDRVGTLDLFIGDGEANRPDAIEINVGGIISRFENVVVAGDGLEWDTLSYWVDIPAGETMVTAQVFSGDGVSTVKADSINWLAAAFSVPIPQITPTPPTPTPTPTATPYWPGLQGCTPGYWKNHLLAWPPTGFSPSDDFDTTFGVDFFLMDKTLLEALQTGGGGINRLGRQGTAALLSAAHPDVDFGFTVAEVIGYVQAQEADTLEAENERGCPLPGWLRIKEDRRGRGR